ncbi:MarR family transcriptional regulator [Desulfobotulus sp. H1]|uniref:MarR family transcriptional regulator n=1 Tax=Desulfobotulus pelophilus TaxID=2823377 RepID=A0ABT3NAC0_9BACT|nr:MarR family transcriptional regulator [Desulfobotulus pelophilus]MCW7753917.1 MarR family transcriptional regulator [Desulfobotulus pelophilus]
MMELKDCVVFLLAKNSQAGYRFWGNYIADLGVTTVQAMLLILLGREEGQTSRQLGEQTQLDSATVSGIIDRLEGLTLINRKRSPEDRRAVLLYLTDIGRDKARELDRRFEEAHQSFLAGFSGEEQNLFRNFLRRLQETHGGIR